MADDKKTLLYSDYQNLPISHITEEDLRIASQIMAARKSITPIPSSQVLYLVEDDEE